MKIISVLIFIATLFLSACQSIDGDWTSSASSALLKLTGNDATVTHSSLPTGANNDNSNKQPTSDSTNSFSPSVLFSGAPSGGPRVTSLGSSIGTITLSGPDTAVHGSVLNTGHVGASKAAGYQPDYIVVVDPSSSVSDDGQGMLVPYNNDVNNGLVLVVTDVRQDLKAISMSMLNNGVKYDYVCNSEPHSSMMNCGANSILLDIDNKTVTLNNAAVENAETKTVLRMSGTLRW